MDIRKLQRMTVGALEDVRARDTRVFSAMHLIELFDRTVIASGTSNRQTEALTAFVRDAVKEAGGHIITVKGEDVGEWVLVDYSDTVVHIMQPQLRLYHNPEEIWGDKSIRIELGSTDKHGLLEVSESYDDGEDEAKEITPARRRITKPRPAGERPTKTAAPAKKTPAKTTPRKPAARYAPGADKPATRTVARMAIKRALTKERAA